jgi:hypothetical protein
MIECAESADYGQERRALEYKTCLIGIVSFYLEQISTTCSVTFKSRVNLCCVIWKQVTDDKY